MVSPTCSTPTARSPATTTGCRRQTCRPITPRRTHPVANELGLGLAFGDERDLPHGDGPGHHRRNRIASTDRAARLEIPGERGRSGNGGDHGGARFPPALVLSEGDGRIGLVRQRLGDRGGI